MFDQNAHLISNSVYILLSSISADHSYILSFTQFWGEKIVSQPSHCQTTSVAKCGVVLTLLVQTCFDKKDHRIVLHQAASQTYCRPSLDELAHHTHFLLPYQELLTFQDCCLWMELGLPKHGRNCPVCQDFEVVPSG